MILGEEAFGDSGFQSSPYEGTWKQSYSFDYLAGTTVSILATLTATIPLGTSVDIYAGEVEDEYTQIYSGLKAPLLFVNPVSGTANIYVKIVLKSSQYGITPDHLSFGFTLFQSTSLYTIATQVLSDGLLPSNSSWLVDTELQKFPIPFAWFEPVKHRYALSKIAEACGGVAYQDRLGVVRVDAGNIFKRTGINGVVFYITDDRILDIASPITDIKNKILVETKPLVELADQIVWTLESDNSIDNGESRTFDIKYSDYDVVLDGYASLSSTPSGASITSETHYSWGCTITILGSANGQVLTLNIYGKPLVIKGSQIIQETDGESIRINGEQTLTINENNLIQSREIAELIAESVIDITSTAQRDIVLSWRGDPTLELGDKGDINGVHGVIVSQEFNFNGALSCSAQIRKV